MIKTIDKKLVVGLEIGSSKISALVGEIVVDEMINIIGVGTFPSKGVNKGNVNNLESVVQCIEKAIDQAEIMSECQIKSVYLSLSGKHINYQNEIGIVPISENEVTREDVDAVVHTAKSVKIPDEHRILHVIPQEYIIDYQDGIKNPIGLSGIRMQAKVHIITCRCDMAKNIVKAVESCGLKVDKLIFSGLASSYSVLTEEEREIGVCVVDIGGGTMDITVYINGSLRYTKVIPYAGNIVTSDIAYAFNTSHHDAEIIKIRYGCALSSMTEKDKNIDLSFLESYPSKILQKQTLAEVIEPRYIELLNLVNESIFKFQKEFCNIGINSQLGAGFVLTGGGSKIKGLIECAEKVFHSQVRIGKPKNITGLIETTEEPCYSTLVGLLHYGNKNDFLYNSKINKNNIIFNWFYKIINWFKREF